MWKLVDLGETIEADMGNGVFMPYRVVTLVAGQLGVRPVQQEAEHATRRAAYPMPDDGQIVTMRKDAEERRAR